MAAALTRRDLCARLVLFAGLSFMGLPGLIAPPGAQASFDVDVQPMMNHERVKIAYTECLYGMDHPNPALRGTACEAYPVYAELTFLHTYTVTKTYTDTQDDDTSLTLRRWTLTYHTS